MTYLADNHQQNLKKVLRTALVGIRPADQVLLKGYLRILLRLEADLEWVSASHGHVDLYLISHEFRDAASVLKLLASQAAKPVLYISRNDDEAGYMADNHIVLPLKKLDNLSDWLMRYVAVLQKGSGSVTNIMQQQAYAPEDEQNTPVTLEVARHTENNIHEAAAPSQPEARPKEVAKPVTPAEPNTPAKDKLQVTPVEPKSSEHSNQNYYGLVRCIKTLQKRTTGLKQISAEHNGTRRRVAILEPSTGRLWQDTTMPVPLNLSWAVEDYIDERPDDKDAADLTQWLWQSAWRQSTLLAPLINDDATYRLRYWVKPALDSQGRAMNAKERREMMRVMTAIEHAPRNVSQLAQRADISVGSSKKIIASLLFAGSLQADNYINIDTRIQRSADATAPSTSNDTARAVERPAAPVQMTMDELLARRARGEHTSAPTSSSADINLTSSSQSAASESEPARAPQPAKSGFLSKLRQKLGL